MGAYDDANGARTRASEGPGDTARPDFARPDFARMARVGIPEIILAATKTDDQVTAIVSAFLERTGRAIVSRPRVATLALLETAFPTCALDVRGGGRIAALRMPDFVLSATGGHVAILTAGTSDSPVAEEARLVAEEMGCRTTALYDVGVAGLHRLLGPLEDLLRDGVDALVVAAGMDGALPSVVAGLSPVPVIGVPTSIGYGFGGRGRAALLSMLQTCAPGLTVVNVDNGVGAGAAAARVANQVAAARGGLAHARDSSDGRSLHGGEDAPTSDPRASRASRDGPLHQRTR